jgi:cyclic 2,3-diphosphoglycerate synthetase
VAEAGTSLEDLERLAAEGTHAASDYLEDALLAGVPAVGCRRVGGGLAGQPFDSNVPEGAALAAARSPGVILFEGSGSCLPPVEVHRTVCVVGEPLAALEGLGPYRLMRSQLVLTRSDHHDLPELAGGPVLRYELRPEPAEELPPGSRVAVFSTSTASVEGVDPVVVSANLSRRRELGEDIASAEREGCDVWLTELKAAAIDTVAARARAAGARVVFIRNRPVGVECDLDAALVSLYEEGARDASGRT